MEHYEYSFSVNHPDGSVDIFPVKFQRSLKSKSIKITPNLAKRIIIVSFPIYILKSTAITFLENNKSWVSKKLERIPSFKTISDGQTISFLGQNYKIKHLPDARRGVWIEGEYIFVSGELDFLNRRVKDFLKNEFKKYLIKQTKYYADKIEKSYKKITIKEITSRWGSCASNGNIVFNWRLCFAPVNVIDYVTAHEVVHLKELNHSIKFWKLVKQICDYNVDEAIQWLNRNGSKLYSID